MISSEDLKILKEHAKTLKELEACAKKLGVKATEKELKEVYETLNDEELEEVSGGFFFGQPVGPRHCKFYCEHCHGKIKDGTENGATCPHCKKFSHWHKENEYTGC